MKCPTCNGSGTLPVLACGEHRSYFEAVRCRQCKGTGFLTDQQARWYADGQRVRAERLKRKMGLRAGAEFCGMDAMEFSDRQFGRMDPAPLLAAFGLTAGDTEVPHEVEKP